MGAAGRSLTGRGGRGAALAAALGALAAAGAGCGGEAVPAMSEEVAPLPEPPLPEAPPVDPLYDAEGRLRESGEVLAGLRLPVGLEPLFTEERRHVYRTEVPLARVQEYFGVRLVTGAVDAREGGGATYRDAVPRDVRGGAVHLDVTVEPSSTSSTRVEIVELAPPPVTPMSEEEALRRLERAMRE